MLSYIHKHLQAMEADPTVTTLLSARAALRPLGLTDFSATLWDMPIQAYPKLSELLPPMAPEDVQRLWTGYVGEVLMGQAVNFARALSENYTVVSGKSLRGSKILDFGCGYGRMLRVLSFYSDEVWGVDPWDESIRVCRSYGLPNVRQSDWLPESLPVDTNFEIAFAFSVFTHLSAKAAGTCLAAMRKHVVDGGVGCITIRPVEYWRMVWSQQGENWLRDRERDHDANGFAYVPHNGRPIDGEVHYGDASMTLDWLAKLCQSTGWKVEGTDRTHDDPVQRYVFLSAV